MPSSALPADKPQRHSGARDGSSDRRARVGIILADHLLRAGTGCGGAMRASVSAAGRYWGKGQGQCFDFPSFQVLRRRISLPDSRRPMQHAVGLHRDWVAVGMEGDGYLCAGVFRGAGEDMYEIMGGGQGRGYMRSPFPSLIFFAVPDSSCLIHSIVHPLSDRSFINEPFRPWLSSSRKPSNQNHLHLPQAQYHT